MPMTLLNHGNTGFCVSKDWLKFKFKSKLMKGDLKITYFQKRALTPKQNKMAVNRIRVPFIIK